MPTSKTTRREFLGRCAAVSTATILFPSVVTTARGETKKDWLSMREDPVRKLFPGKPDLDKILSLYPRPTGKPAFDKGLIAENIRKLRTTPEVNTGHPFLDLSVKTGLAYIDATFDGDHPKYGVDFYARVEHEGFPPTIIAAVDALSAWGMKERADQLLHYWIQFFIQKNGRFDYYGPSIAEYGQFLHTAASFEQRLGTATWWDEGFGLLDQTAEYLLEIRATAIKEEPDGLIAGVPEADTRKNAGKYFHNNGWVVKGLKRWADLCERQKAKPTTSPDAVRKVCAGLEKDTLSAIQKTWPADRADWWLPPRAEPMERPTSLTSSREASYTNYRYWPELLSSEILPADLANRVVDARLRAGGQFCGMTRFKNHMDDWPLADYLYGLWSLGRKNDFLLSLYGHVAYHQAQDHLTAYEQVSFPPGRRVADYCLPCQLVAARAARLLV